MAEHLLVLDLDAVERAVPQLCPLEELLELAHEPPFRVVEQVALELQLRQPAFLDALLRPERLDERLEAVV